ENVAYRIGSQPNGGAGARTAPGEASSSRATSSASPTTHRAAISSRDIGAREARSSTAGRGSKEQAARTRASASVMVRDPWADAGAAGAGPEGSHPSAGG